MRVDHKNQHADRYEAPKDEAAPENVNPNSVCFGGSHASHPIAIEARHQTCAFDVPVKSGFGNFGPLFSQTPFLARRWLESLQSHNLSVGLQAVRHPLPLAICPEISLVSEVHIHALSTTQRFPCGRL
jgi:hypothetical protein